jgi:hypothetical protein
MASTDQTGTESRYLDHLIRNRDGHISIYRPDGTLLLTGRLTEKVARALVESVSGDHKEHRR